MTVALVVTLEVCLAFQQHMGNKIRCYLILYINYSYVIVIIPQQHYYLDIDHECYSVGYSRLELFNSYKKCPFFGCNYGQPGLVLEVF